MFFLSSRRRHTRCALVTGVQTCALPICRVRVTAEMAADTPIRADSEATLQLQGITGVSYVQITPGSPEAELIKPVRGGDTAKYPTIKSKPSAIDTLVEAAPELQIGRAHV